MPASKTPRTDVVDNRARYSNGQYASGVGHLTFIQMRDLAAELEERNAELSAMLLLSQPWSLVDIVTKLRDAARTLLDRESYDGHGHEEVRRCEIEATAWLDALTPEKITAFQESAGAQLDGFRIVANDLADNLRQRISGGITISGHPSLFRTMDALAKLNARKI